MLDLISKILILTFEGNLPISLIDNILTIDKVINYGAAFSLFQGGRIILIIIAIIVLYYINKSFIKEVTTNKSLISLSMLTGGIIGNLFDRVVYGKVIDFINVDIFGYKFPVFNLADTFICIGIILLIIEEIVEKGEENGNRSK